MNNKDIKIKGNKARPYAISVGTLEFNDKPRPRYMASITQMIPIRVYFLVAKRYFSTSNL